MTQQSHLGEYTQKNVLLKKLKAALHTCSTTHTSKIWKQTQCPLTDDWIRRMMYIHNGILLRHKKEKNAIHSPIDGIRNPYTKRKKSERDTKIPKKTPLIWNLTNGSNELFIRKETHGQENRFVVIRLEGEGVGRTGIWGVRDPKSCTWCG